MPLTGALVPSVESCGATVVQPIDVCTLAELLLLFASIDVVETVAVLVIVCGPPGETLYVAAMLTLCPPLSVPMLHGNALHAPLTETSERRAGVGSESVTPVAGAAPTFFTVML